VRFLETADGLVVWGTASGAPSDPDWFHNLRAAKVADVEVMDKRLQVRPRELVGAERDAMWNDLVLAQLPGVARYASRRPNDPGSGSRAKCNGLITSGLVTRTSNQADRRTITS
jgi:F420H(2)-dependent quinone reductase